MSDRHHICKPGCSCYTATTGRRPPWRRESQSHYTIGEARPLAKNFLSSHEVAGGDVDTPKLSGARRGFAKEMEDWLEITGALSYGSSWYAEAMSIAIDADRQVAALEARAEQAERERDELRDEFRHALGRDEDYETIAAALDASENEEMRLSRELARLRNALIKKAGELDKYGYAHVTNNYRRPLSEWLRALAAEQEGA